MADTAHSKVGSFTPHGRPRRRGRIGRGRIGLAGLIVCAIVGAGVSTGSAASTATRASGSQVKGAAYTPHDWPELHANPTLSGYQANSSLSTATASTLGVKWSSSLYGPALDSPVVDYDTTLGESLVYIGTENGDVLAVALKTGQIVWSVWLGSPIRSSPVVIDNMLFIVTLDTHTIYELNATTGAIDCSAMGTEPFEGTPTVVTPPGGVQTLYVGSNDEASANGPVIAMATSNCHIEWEFTGYPQTAGSWDSVSYAVDADGVPLIVFGTSDPDCGIYAVNAVTGVEVWRFQAADPNHGDYDIGAGAEISPPGVNGFADGVAYVPSKVGIIYALDLTTGAQIWQYEFDTPSTQKGRSTPALDGVNLVFGYGSGMVDLNAVTGKLIWDYDDPTNSENIASPAIAGAAGKEVVVGADVAGGVEVVSLASGKMLYRYETGGYITASPAIDDGDILVASTDGHLYNFAVGGGNDPVLPSTTITSPADLSTVPNPNGSLTVAGTAADPVAVAAVEVAVQIGGPAGMWWDAATGGLSGGPIANPATLASPGATSTKWTFSYPVPAAGAAYEINAYAISSSGQSDIKGADSAVAVEYSKSGPHVETSDAFAAPGGTVEVKGGGFAAGEKVAISLDGTNLATVTASTGGSFNNTTVDIPTSELFGQASLLASGETSGRSASVAVTITNNWAQLGYDAARTGYEPNDSILRWLISPGHGIFVDMAWSFNAGDPVDSSPAIVDGIAYVGDTSGNLYAIDTHNAGLLWTYTLPSGDAIDGSPAVDASAGLVIFGADDGTVDAVSLSTGDLVWSSDVGGDVNAPALDDGVVYVSSSNGAVEALSESTGSSVWSVTLPGTISAAPSVDTAANDLVVGEGDDVVELNLTTGAQNWSYATGAPVSDAAMIYSGVAYAGSGDDLYALSESTGDLAWTFATDGAVTSTAAVANVSSSGKLNHLVVGTGDGDLYAIAPNGKMLFDVKYKGAIIGLAAVLGVDVFETSAGAVECVRSDDNNLLWTYSTGTALTTVPTVVDGTIYVGAGDGNLYAFTSYGQPPST